MPELSHATAISADGDYTWFVPETAWYLIHLTDASWTDGQGDITLLQNGAVITDFSEVDTVDTLKVVALMKGTLTVQYDNQGTNTPSIWISRMQDQG